MSRVASSFLVAFVGVVLSLACRSHQEGLSPGPAAARADGGAAGAAGRDAAVEPAPSQGSDAGFSSDADAEAACMPGATRCAVGAAIVEVCQDGGVWKVRETCTSVCMAGACAGQCRPGDRRCGANQTPETCTAHGEWKAEAACPVLCTGAGLCAVCMPSMRRCSVDGAIVEECSKDGSAYTQSEACANGCQTGKCNLCVPGSKVCSGTTLRSCRANGTGFDDEACKPPAGGGGEAVCAESRCDVNCAPGRIKMGDRCACPANMSACAGACAASNETITLPAFHKPCAAPHGETCDPYTFPIMIEGCAKEVEVTIQASPGHCAPIYVQMLANGVPKGPRSEAIAPGEFSVPLKLGPLGPGLVTLGFQATVARAGCGLAGVLTGWGASARLSLTIK